MIGFGTYKFLDCAQFYGNEKEVGKAISRSEWFDRDDLYLASRSGRTRSERAAVRKQIDATLKALRTDRLDLYLVHWPVPGKHVDAYLELQGAVKAGKIRPSASNYAAEDVDELLDHPGVYITPAVNQIELNPFLYRPKTLKYMADKGIVVQAYRALRDGKAFEDPTVLRVAAKPRKDAPRRAEVACARTPLPEDDPGIKRDITAG
ncbi:oxidoreductase [Aureococcus anophagefferens]|nr:oxidoreductase [Aureococcus anophagefferens]